MAIIQIDGAIEEYERNTLGSYLCACTLAHAASGILEHLPGVNKAIFEKIKKMVASGFPEMTDKEISDALNMTGNGLKHVYEDFCEEDFDPQERAQYCINRAIYAVHELGIAKTTRMNEWGLKMQRSDMGVAV